MNNKYKVISESFLFSGIDFQNIDKIYSVTEKAELVSFVAGDVILSSEKNTDALCIVASGQVYISSDMGDKETVLRFARCGDMFGAASLFSREPHKTKVHAVDKTEIVFIYKDLLCDLIRGCPEISLNYIGFLSNRIAFLNKKIAAFTAGSAEAKLALYLINNVNDDNCVICKSSMSSIADQLGIGRASLYRAIDSLSNSNIIRHEDKKFTLIDKERLYDIVK